MTFPILSFRSRLICRALTYPICAAALCAISLSAQPLGHLTASDIEAAINWGTHGEPTAYRLHHRSPDPAKVNPVIVGAV